jgi:hypothetical protein
MAIKRYSIAQYNYDFDARAGGPRLLQLWSTTALIADIRFYPDSAALPALSISANLSGAVMYFHWSMFSPLIDMLRNEKPINVTINTDQSPAVVLIGTDQEPVGEGE